MPTIDIGQIIAFALPIVVMLFPGIRNIFVALPQSFFDAVVAAKGGKITWTAQQSRADARQRLFSAAESARTEPSEANALKLAAAQAEFAAIGDGTLLEKIKPYLPIIIIGVVGFMVMNKGGGCNKPTPPVTPPKPAATAPEVTVSPANPLTGLAQLQQ